MKNFLSGLLFLGLFFVSCQTKYDVGISKVSIEPTDETVSLTLSGFAAPYLGRFTLTWEEVDVSTNDVVMKQLKEASRNDPAWADIDEPKEIISLTHDSRNLYAVMSNGWLIQRPLKQKDAVWVRMGYNNGDTYTIDAKQIVYSQGKLYVLASDGKLYRSRHSTAGDLSVTAMAIRNGKSTVIIAGVDVCGLDYSFTQSIKEEISRRRAIPMEAIMINVSHTHFAPVTQKWPTWGEQNQRPDSLYLNQVVRKGIVQAIEEALDQMKPSYLYFGRDTTDIGFNRSLRNELAVYDNAVDVLKVTSTDGKMKSLLFLTGCHPVFTDPTSGHYTANANFPGHARKMIEEKTDVVSTIFLQGCAADINPKDPYKTSGAKLAGDVIRVLEKEMTPITGNIRFVMDSLLIPTNPWTKEQISAFMEASIGKTNDYMADRNFYWSALMMDYYADNAMPAYMPIYIQTLDIGDWKLIGLSREATTEFGLAIRKIWPDKKVSVAAYTNDVSSYLATDPHISAKDYEGYDSFFWYAQPSPFPLKVFDTVIERISKTGGNVSDAKDNFIRLRYDKHNHSLLMELLESATYIKKIKLDLQQDTLIIRKVSKKLVPRFGKENVRMLTNCIIELQSNVEYVKFGNTLYKLSEMDEYSQDKIRNMQSVLTVFPKKFPCVIP